MQSQWPKAIRYQSASFGMLRREPDLQGRVDQARRNRGNSQ